jgi:hypothetical protein
MEINNGYIIVGLIIAFGLIFELAAHADDRNGATTITFGQSIQVPSPMLPAGPYSFKLANTDVVYSVEKEKEPAHDTRRTIVANEQTNANSKNPAAGN